MRLFQFRFIQAAIASTKGCFHRRKTPFKRGDCVAKIVPTRCQCSGEDRIGGVGAVRYPGVFLFGGDVAVEETDGAIKIIHHSPDYRGFSKHSCTRNLKMTLVFHLQAPK